MTKGKRIKSLRENAGVSQVDLASKIGVSKQTLYKYENDIVTNIPSNKIEAIAAVFQSTPAYIMGWSDSTTPVSSHNFPPIQTQRLPVLGSVAAGEPLLMTQEKEFYVDTPIKADFVLIAKGDSMTGARINDGDIVFVKQQPCVMNGEIAVVAIDDEATLKRFYKYGNELIVLRAENPKYKDIEIRPEDGKNVRILGKAVTFQSEIK